MKKLAGFGTPGIWYHLPEVSGIASQLLHEAERNLATQGHEGPDTPDYALLAETFRSHAELDSAAGFAGDVACARHPSRAIPPAAPTLRGRLGSLVARIVSPVLWRLVRASSVHDPLQAIYQILLEQQERQIKAQATVEREIAAIRTRLDAIETALRSRRPSD